MKHSKDRIEIPNSYLNPKLNSENSLKDVLKINKD
jgi:hypothetical protein